MKKIILSLIIGVLFFLSLFFLRQYRFEAGDKNFGNIGIFGESIGKDGNVHYMQSDAFPSGIQELTIEAVAQKKSLHQVKITWYNGEEMDDILKEEIVTRNETGVFVSTIHDLESLEKGRYLVEIDIPNLKQTPTERISFVIK